MAIQPPMTKHSLLTREVLIAFFVGVPGLIGIRWPAWGLAAEVSVLAILGIVLIDAIQRILRRLLDLEAPTDGSCSWQTREAFFDHLCTHIHGHNLEKERPSELLVYRGYDHGPSDENEQMRQEIIAAMIDERISKFRRVMVVTTKNSIPMIVDWVSLFAEDPRLLAKCEFYISFRQNFNLGSYVALEKNCFIAMPLMEPDEKNAYTQTACGVFTPREAVKAVISTYIGNLRTMAINSSIHAIKCPLAEHVHAGKLDRGGLQTAITAGYEAFLDADKAKGLPEIQRAVKRLSPQDLQTLREWFRDA
jgi:hypothetical protein